MINITVTGTTLAECQNKVLALAEEVKAMTKEKVTTVVEPITLPVEIKVEMPELVSEEKDERGVPFLPEVHATSKELTTKGSWRKRRGVKDKELSEAEAPYIEIEASKPEVVIPNAPTSAVRVALPVVEKSVLNEMILPPVEKVTAENAYDFNSFKANLVPLLHNLVTTGKLDHDWVNQTKESFGGKEVFLWAEDDESCLELFEIFIEAELITKLEV